MAQPSRRRSRERRPLRRTVESRAPRRTVLVFCEGKRTEPEYLKALKREPTVREIASVDIKIRDETAGSVPLTLVRAAIEARGRSEDEKGEVDEIWCVFDVEWPKNHPNLRQAIVLAGANNISVAISNPCFELWLALHFDDQTAWLTTKEAVSLRRSHDGSSGKGLDGLSYMIRRDDAARRARVLVNRHLNSGTEFPHDNPSSGMHRFLEAIERREDGTG